MQGWDGKLKRTKARTEKIYKGRNEVKGGKGT